MPSDFIDEFLHLFLQGIAGSDGLSDRIGSMASFHTMILAKMRAAMEGVKPAIISGKTNVLKG